MTVSTGKRSFRACDRCRQRKIKCDLSSIGEEGKPPCSECHRRVRECTLPPSRRGGDYTRYRRHQRSRSSRTALDAISITPQEDPQSIATHGAVVVESRLHSSISSLEDTEGEPMHVDELRNPSDALQILARTTSISEGRGNHGPANAIIHTRDEHSMNGRLPVHNLDQLTHLHTGSGGCIRSSQGIESYKPVAQGLLDPAVVQTLISLYAQKYHSFVPIVPKHILDPSNIDHAARDESFLLTVILTTASKDGEVWEIVHRRCWDYMQELLLDVLLARPHTHRIGLVEGLLLLSDWLPSAHSGTSSTSKSLLVEDATAWSLIRQAVRHAYLLRLDRTSFREDFLGESKEKTDRKRLVWTFVYLADRQISVRLGQAFWSRGPSLSSRFTATDFPTLQASFTSEDDQASVLQATMELTQLLRNAHDILYSSRARTRELILAGDYNRYLDDFQKALLSWNETWNDMLLTPKIKCVLTLIYEYLCLYVNAFAFQAKVTQMVHEARNTSGPQPFTLVRQQCLFRRGIMATPEGRYIFEALRAAKPVMKVMGQADPVLCLRYMPNRYYLYSVYSAVFLYKANSFGSFPSDDEQEEIATLVQDFVINLQQAATNDKHIAWHYGKLLRGLSFRLKHPSTSSNRHPSNPTPSRRSHECGAEQPAATFAGGSNIDFEVPAPSADSTIPAPSSTAGRNANLSDNMPGPPEPSEAVYYGNIDPFDIQSTSQTDSLLETLFGVDNINFVPPFTEDMMF